MWNVLGKLGFAAALASGFVFTFSQVAGFLMLAIGITVSHIHDIRNWSSMLERVSTQKYAAYHRLVDAGDADWVMEQIHKQKSE